MMMRRRWRIIERTDFAIGLAISRCIMPDAPGHWRRGDCFRARGLQSSPRLLRWLRVGSADSSLQHNMVVLRFVSHHEWSMSYNKQIVAANTRGIDHE
jgi:hypothetical protein